MEHKSKLSGGATGPGNEQHRHPRRPLQRLVASTKERYPADLTNSNQCLVGACLLGIVRDSDLIVYVA